MGRAEVVHGLAKDFRVRGVPDTLSYDSLVVVESPLDVRKLVVGDGLYHIFNPKDALRVQTMFPTSP